VFPTEDFQNFIPNLRQAEQVFATGGGSAKFKDSLPEGTEYLDELETVINGIRLQNPQTVGFDQEFVLVNAGTGASIVHVKNGRESTKNDKDDKSKTEPSYVRIGGTGVCGGVFSGLSKILLKTDDPWNEISRILNNTELRDSNQYHTLVKDIYGEKQAEIYGLPGDLVAGFLGKVKFDSDVGMVVSGIQESVTCNLAHLACLQTEALRAKNPDIPIVFTGGYLTLPRTERIIQIGVDIFANGSQWMLHADEFSGSIGCLNQFLRK